MHKEIFIELLKRTGLNQKEFSARSGIAEPRISEWLTGKRNPKLSVLNELANKFGFEIELSWKIKSVKV